MPWRYGISPGHFFMDATEYSTGGELCASRKRPKVKAGKKASRYNIFPKCIKSIVLIPHQGSRFEAGHNFLFQNIPKTLKTLQGNGVRIRKKF